MILLSILGRLVMVLGFVALVVTLSGVADPWLMEHWTCATGGGPHGGIARSTPCDWWDVKSSSVQLSGAVIVAGFVGWAIADIKRGANKGPRVGMTIDLSRGRRVS